SFVSSSPWMVNLARCRCGGVREGGAYDANVPLVVGPARFRAVRSVAVNISSGCVRREVDRTAGAEWPAPATVAQVGVRLVWDVGIPFDIKSGFECDLVRGRHQPVRLNTEQGPWVQKLFGPLGRGPTGRACTVGGEGDPRLGVHQLRPIWCPDGSP